MFLQVRTCFSQGGKNTSVIFMCSHDCSAREKAGTGTVNSVICSHLSLFNVNKHPYLRRSQNRYCVPYGMANLMRMGVPSNGPSEE